jgi:Protein of unknown function (DUF4230)
MWKIIGITILILIIVGFIYSFFKPQGSNNFNVIFLVVGLMLGVMATYFLTKGFSKPNETITNVHTITQSIERVFKIVTAEGHFSEIYDYENTEHLLSFIPSTKKALIVVNAKVLMGFDMKKLKTEINEETKKIRILEFPQPEILSIEPDMKYYNLENGIFNKFDNEDLTKLQVDAKLKIKEAALKSELPLTAQKQMQTLLLEMASIQQWQLEGSEKITSQLKLLNGLKNE